MFVKLKTKRVIASLLIICMIMTSNSLFSFANSLGNGNNLDETEVSESVSESIDTTDDEFELPGEIDLESETKTAVDEMDGEALDTPDVNEEEEELEAESETESLDIESTEEENTETVDEEKEEAERVTKASEETSANSSSEVSESSEQSLSEDKNKTSTQSEVDEVVDVEETETLATLSEIPDKEETSVGAGETKSVNEAALKEYLQNTNMELLLAEEVSLSSDVVIDYEVKISTLKDITIKTNGHKVTFANGFKFGEFKSNFKIVSEESEKTNVVFNFDAADSAAATEGKMFTFDNVNVTGTKIDIKNMNIEFVDCSFNIAGSGEILVRAVNSNVKMGNFDVEGKSSGFILDNSKMELTSINMRNNTVDTLFKVLNNSELTIKGKAVYEGNKNIYYVENSKLTVLDGSKYAKDILRDPESLEYTEKIITKKHTKLLDPDSDDKMDIVYRRNTGSYVIGVKNAVVEFDGVIIANEFTGDSKKQGAYVNLGSETSKLTLLNRAYVNQNTKNIVATAHDEFYGSKTNDDGSFETLNRDATLSFYPTEDGLTLLREVIKRNENSLIFTARDYKTDDEWNFISEGFFYKACMIQNYTDDFYLGEPLSYGTDVVTCEVENLGSGMQKGTFKLAPREVRNVKIVFHLGNGVVDYVPFKIGEFNITEKLEGLEYIPSFKMRNDYRTDFTNDFNSVKPKWIDETIEGEPYEYKFVGWSTTTDHLITAPRTDGLGKTSCGSIGHLEKGVEDILDKFGKYDYLDTLNLYACWQGDLKLTVKYKAVERQLDPEVQFPIKKWVEKETIVRSGHPFRLATYVEPDDYEYEGFTLIGWQERYNKDKNVDYTIEFLGEKYSQGQEVTCVRNSVDAYEYAPIEFYAVFEGDEYDVYWYMNSEGIKEVDSSLKSRINEQGFYHRGTKTKLGEIYSRLNPKISLGILSDEYVNYTLEEGVEFIGWTKEEIKKPLTDEELKDVKLVNDYLKGYSTKGDSYYYPVLHYSPVVASHDGYIALSDSYLNAQVVLTEGHYELGANVGLTTQMEVVGDITIDLHGHELSLAPGSYFYGSGNMTFTDCKHDETDLRKRGTIVNGNGVIYKGPGELNFKNMTFGSGTAAHRFESLQHEVTLDNVELRENEFSGIFQRVDDDLYPRLMQIDNTVVNIINTHLDKVDGKIAVMNGGVLNLTNFTMTNCRASGEDAMVHIWATNKSKVTVNAPCYFENNSDIFVIENSSLEINSNATYFNKDFDEIKDEAVIFTGNYYESIIHSKASDIKLSGIFYKNKTRLPIVNEMSGSSKKSIVHFDGYIYVMENDRDGQNYSGMGMFGNIIYRQSEGDVFDANSEMEYYTYYWSSYFRCDPFACREYKILENLSQEEMEAINANRDENGFLRTFRLKNPQNGYGDGVYRPIIDGINFNEDTGRGYEIIYNYEFELDIIDVEISQAYYSNYIKFKDMDGNEVFNTVVQYDKKNPDKFLNWWNNLTFESVRDDVAFDKVCLKHPVTLELDDKFNLDKANASVRLVLLTKSLTVPERYYVNYEMKRPKNIDEREFENDKSGVVTVYGLGTVGLDDNNNAEYSGDDWYEIKGINISNEDEFPFVFEGWQYSDSTGNYLLKPGQKYQMFKDFAKRRQYVLNAKWRPKQVSIVYKLGQYMSINGESGEYIQIATLGEAAKLIDPSNVKVDNRFILTGWYVLKDGMADPNRYEVTRKDGVKVRLGDYMLPNASIATREISNDRLGSQLYINKSTEYILYPVYFPRNSTILGQLVDERANQTITDDSDDYKYILDAHTKYGVTFKHFYRNENTISQNTCVGEAVEVTNNITINGNIEICLHGNSMNITTGKFIVPEGSKLTFRNCKSSAGPNLGTECAFEGDGEIVFDNLSINATNTIVLDTVNVKFNKGEFTNIKTSGSKFVDIKDSNVTFERMTFDGLAKGFVIDNSYVKLSGVSVKNSTCDVLFYVKNNSKVDISKFADYNKYEFVNSIFENNKNIALVDNSKFMTTGNKYIDDDTMTDAFLGYTVNSGKYIATRNPVLYDVTSPKVNDSVWFSPENIKLLDTRENEFDVKRLERVVFRNNTGSYIFGAKNNAQVFFNGVAYNNKLTADANGKMGAYVNLGGKNTLVLRNNPYINRNSRNIVVTDNDTITNATDEPEYQHGKAFSKDATLSFYITKRKNQKILTGTAESWMVGANENPFGTDNYKVHLDTGVFIDNYFQPSCMIEGYRDNLFKDYDSTYAGNKMNVEFKRDVENPNEIGFYGVTDETQDIINITFHANGGEFRNFDNTATVSEITLPYNKLSENREIENYINKLKPVIYDKELGLEGTFRGWQYTPTWPKDSVRGLSIWEIKENTTDVDVYAIYLFPEIVTVTFRAEKGGKETLKGKAYTGDFEEVTVKLLLDDTYGLSGTITAPSFGDIQAMSGWKLGNRWISENNNSHRYLEPGKTQKYVKDVMNNDAITYYYIELIDTTNPIQPSYYPTRRSSGGSGGGGGGGGGGSAVAPSNNNAPAPGNNNAPSSFLDVLSNAINSLMNPQNNQLNANNQQAVTANAQAAAISGPTTDNPFAAKTEINALGVAVTQTNEQVGFEQFGKAMATMQQAAATGQTDKANVSQVSMSMQDANWTKAADGSWSLSSNNAMNAGEVKNTWQPVTDATGKANWYKFDANGKMQTGWIVDNNKAYYLLESGTNQGALVTGVTLDIGGFKFSFDNTGALVDLKAGN